MPSERVEIGFSEQVTRGMELVNAAFDEGQELVEQHAKALEKASTALSEYGTTAVQAADVTDDLVSLNAKYNANLSVTARLFEELVKETQSVDKATRQFGLVMEFAAQANLKTNEAAAKFAGTARGQTAAFRDLTSRAGRLAGMLDQIKDKNLRARLATKLLMTEMRRGDGVIDKFTDNLQVLRVKAAALTGGFDLMTPALKGLALGLAGAATAAAAAALAIGKYGFEAVKAFLQTTPDGRHEVVLLDKSLRNLKVTVGRVVTGILGLKDSTKGLITAVAVVESAVSGLFRMLSSTVAGLVDFSVGVFEFSISIHEATGDLLGYAATMRGAQDEVEEIRQRTEDAIDANRKYQASLRETAEATKFESDFRAVQNVLIREGIAALDDEQRALFMRSQAQFEPDVQKGIKAREAARDKKEAEDEKNNKRDQATAGKKGKQHATVYNDAFQTTLTQGFGAGILGNAIDVMGEIWLADFAAELDARSELLVAAEQAKDAKLSAARVAAGEEMDLNRASMQLFIETGLGLEQIPILWHESARASREARLETEKNAQAQEELNEALNVGGMMVGALTDTYSTLMVTIGQGTKIQGGFANALLGSMGDVLTMMGKSFLAISAGMLNLGNPFALAAAGVFALSLGGILRGVSNKGAAGVANLPTGAGGGASSTTGGGFSGPSLGSGRVDRERGGRESRLVVNIAGREVEGIIENVALGSMDRNRTQTATALAKYRPRHNSLRG